MGNLQKVVYLSESQAQELFTNETITVDGVTVNYSADDLYLTPDDSGNFVLKTGDTMTGALKAKGLRTYVSDTLGNASLNFGETADSTRMGRITMNTTTNIMEFDEGNERYLLPAPTASSETLYDVVTTNGSYTLGGQLNTPGINSYAATWPGYGFALNTAPTTALASLNYDDSNKCFTFVSNANDGTGTTEAFSLPQETLTDGNWHGYAILTSKTPVTIAQGGTNATTAADALTSLGAVAKSGDTMTGTLKNTSALPVQIVDATGAEKMGIYMVGEGTSQRWSFRQYTADGTHRENFNLPNTTDGITANANYNIITNKNITQTLPGQLILSKTTDVGASASSEGALVIGTKTGQHLAFDDNEIMAKASATTVNTLNINYDGGNVVLGVNNTSYNVQIRSTAAASSATTGALRVGGGIGVGSGIYSNGDIMIQGSTAPMLHLRRSDGTELGSFYGLVSSGRLILRTWNSTGTYYADYQLPDDSANDGFRAYNILTSKDFKYSSANQSSGTLAGFVGSDAGVWIVSMYDGADAAKYWIGTISKKSGANPVVTTIANATIDAPWGNTIGTIVFSGATGNYVVQGIKIV